MNSLQLKFAIFFTSGVIALGITIVHGEEEPEQLLKMRGAYEKAIESATAPIQQKYIQAL
jgi:hypothetical protein